MDAIQRVFRVIERQFTENRKVVPDDTFQDMGLLADLVNAVSVFFSSVPMPVSEATREDLKDWLMSEVNISRLIEMYQALDKVMESQTKEFVLNLELKTNLSQKQVKSLVEKKLSNVYGISCEEISLKKKDG